MLSENGKNPNSNFEFVVPVHRILVRSRLHREFIGKTTEKKDEENNKKPGRIYVRPLVV